jgi:hypothetical protein
MDKNMEIGKGGGHDLAKINSSDRFTRVLEMMRSNGTDEQTVRVYTNILDIFRFNVSGLKKQPAGLLQNQDLPGPFASLLSFWEQPRLEITGLPIVTGINPDNPTFILDANYHNDSIMQVGNVCIDDPTITSETGFIMFRKPDGTPNSATRIEINPGNIGIPGGIYDVNPINGKAEELTTGLRQRIDDVLSVCLEYSRAVSESDDFSRFYVAEGVLRRVCEDWRTLDGKKIKDHVNISELYQYILSGRVKRKGQVTSPIRKIADKFKSQSKTRLLPKLPSERPESPGK